MGGGVTGRATGAGNIARNWLASLVENQWRQGAAHHNRSGLVGARDLAWGVSVPLIVVWTSVTTLGPTMHLRQ